MAVRALPKKFFESVVLDKEPPRLVTNLVSVKPRQPAPAKKAQPRFDLVLEQAKSKFVRKPAGAKFLEKMEKKFKVARANRSLPFRSILARKIT